MSFQTCMPYFLLWTTQEVGLKKVCFFCCFCFFHTLKVNRVQCHFGQNQMKSYSTCLLLHFAKVKQVWNDINKWWWNFHLWLNGPFKADAYTLFNGKIDTHIPIKQKQFVVESNTGPFSRNMNIFVKSISIRTAIRTQVVLLNWISELI